MLDSFAYFNKYDDDDFHVRKHNRRRKIDKRSKAREDFMKVNGAGLKSVILPLLEKKAKESREKRKGQK